MANLPNDQYVDIVFDGPPSHESGRFIEVEDASGKSISIGEWVHRPDNYWALRIPPTNETLRGLLAERQVVWCDEPVPGQSYPEYACGKCWTCRVRATLTALKETP